MFHYTGMGKSGNQDIHWAQNATLAACGYNGVDVHLFEVIDEGEYIYCGRIELVDKPYTETQLGEDGVPRRVWMFPVRPIPDNEVKKPQLFIFKDMDDYRKRGKDVDVEYSKMIAAMKNRESKPKTSNPIIPVVPRHELKPHVCIPEDYIGKHVKHKVFGIGKIKEIYGTTLVILFDIVGVKKIEYTFCMEKNLLEFVYRGESEKN